MRQSWDEDVSIFKLNQLLSLISISTNPYLLHDTNLYLATPILSISYSCEPLSLYDSFPLM